MKWLPAIFKRGNDVAASGRLQDSELHIELARSQIRTADAICRLSEFVTGEGLSRTLGAVGRSNAAAAILQGLVAAEGRDGLDARTIKQNAIETCHLVQEVFRQFEEKLNAQGRVDPGTHNAEEGSGFTDWQKKQEGR